MKTSRKLLDLNVLLVMLVVGSATLAQNPDSLYQGGPVVTYDVAPSPRAYAQGDAQAGADILLIQTSDPWENGSTYLGASDHDGVTSDTLVLDTLGKSYHVATWSQIENGSVDIFSYQVVLIVNDQVQAFYDAYASKKAQFEQYVSKGGTLLFFSAGGGWAGGVLHTALPGNVSWFWQGGIDGVDLFQRNRIAKSDHPIVNAILSNNQPLQDGDLYSNWCSHGYFTSLVSGTTVILRDTSDHPTLIEYKLGNGSVIASTLTWEHNWHYHNGGDGYGTFARKALDDVFLYAFSIAGGHVRDLQVDVYPEDNWLAIRPATYKCEGDLIDIAAVIQNNTENNLSGVQLSVTVDDSLFEPGYLKVFKRNSADHIAIETYDNEKYTQFTDATTSGKRLITIQNLTITPQKLMPNNVWNDFVFQFRIRRWGQNKVSHSIDATAQVTASGLPSFSEKLSDGGLVMTKWSSPVILVNRKGLYQQYAVRGNQVDFTQGGGRDQIHQLWESLYRIAAERYAVIEFVDKIEYAEDDDHNATSDIIREWPVDRLHLANGDTQGHYHYDTDVSTKNEEGTINQVANKVDRYLTEAINRSGGIPRDGRYVLILGGDNVVPFYRAFSPGNQVYGDRNAGYNATSVTQTDANNNYFFTDIIYRDFDGNGWESGDVEDVFVGRIAGPNVTTMRSLFESSDLMAQTATQVVKMENKARDGNQGLGTKYETDATGAGYTVLSTANGRTLDKPGSDPGDDPAQWDDLRILFTSQQFDAFRCIAHGNVKAIKSSEDTSCPIPGGGYCRWYHPYITGANIIASQGTISTAFGQFVPMFVFDNCLVGLVDGTDNSDFFNAFSNLPIRGFMGSSCITYSSSCSVHNNLFTESLFNGYTDGRSLNYANKEYSIGWIDFSANTKKNTKMQMNLFGVPWAKLVPPNKRPAAHVAMLKAGASVTGESISAANGVFTKSLVIDSSVYTLETNGVYDLLNVAGFKSWQDGGAPVLPYGEYVVELPDDVAQADVTVQYRDVLSLGAKRVPVYASPIPYEGAVGDYGGGVYRACPNNLGIFPPAPAFDKWLIAADGGKHIRVRVFPAQYDTGTRQLQLARSVTIAVSYASQTKGKLHDASLDADIYAPSQAMLGTATIENTSDQQVLFTIAATIYDLAGNVVLTETATETIASGAVADIGLDFAAPVEPGNYRVEIQASDGGAPGNLGNEEKSIRVVCGKITGFDVPQAILPSEPATFGVSFFNMLQGAVTAAVDIAIYRVSGGQTAKLPQFVQAVAGQTTAKLATEWIPASDTPDGLYCASAIITANSTIIGPVVAYFGIGNCFLTCPTDVSQINDAGQCGAIVDYALPTTIGACSAITCDPPSGSFFPVGTTAVICSDATGASCSFNVTVNDTEPPAITCLANIVATSSNASGSVVSYPTPVASDNCSIVTVVCIPPSGNLFPTGVTMVACTATDVAGNMNSCTFTVEVKPADADKDGVPDYKDRCPNTPAGAIINACGCSIDQLVPCDGPREGGKWKSHGQYVQAVVATATDFLKAKLITRRQWMEIVTGAARSKCGWNRRCDRDWDRDWQRNWDCDRDRDWGRGRNWDKD